MGFNDLPKINERKAKSNEMQLELESKLLKFIIDFEKENDYEFQTYEVDNVFLGMVKRNHEKYIRSRFGSDVIFK